MINLVVEEPYQETLDWSFLEQAAQAALEHEGKSAEVELTLVIDGDEKLQELNRQFLEIDASTDVLSFPSEEIDPETGNAYLGYVIISYPRAQSQAEAAGHAVESELQLLTVHGVLHLLGYDHADEGEKKAMWAAQQEVLTGLGSQLSRFPD
jgi:probable rRNA maturation factor